MVALVAAAVTFWITKSFQLAGKILSAFGAAGTTNAVAIAAANAAAGAIAGAAGSVAGQGVGVLTGIQDRIDWRGVGMSAISGAVSGYMGPSQSGGFIAGLERGVASNVVTQTIGVAVGLQKKFDWAGVAAAGLQGGVSTLVANSSWLPQASANPLSPSSLLNAAIPGVAGAVASAAAQSALTRTDFGDNLRALLPEVIGSTIGNALAARAVTPLSSQTQSAEASQGTQGPPVVTPQDIWRAQQERLGLDPDAPMPNIVLVDGLKTQSGKRAFGRFTPGQDPGDPGTIALDARLVRRASYSPTAAAQLYTTLAEEYGGAAAGVASETLVYRGRSVDTGAILGGLQTLSTISGLGANDTLRFSLGGQVYATDRRQLTSAFSRTFTPERLLANIEDGTGSYQTTQGRFGPLPPLQTMSERAKSFRPADQNIMVIDGETWEGYDDGRINGIRPTQETLDRRAGNRRAIERIQLQAESPIGASASMIVRGAGGDQRAQDTALFLGVVVDTAAQAIPAGRSRGLGAAEKVPARLPQDLAISPKSPSALPLGRPIGLSPTQNAAIQAVIIEARTAGGTSFRVNQQQVDAAGNRVGINRPDLQYTDVSGRRIYIEYDTPRSTRGPDHQNRILANDPAGNVILKTVR